MSRLMNKSSLSFSDAPEEDDDNPQDITEEQERHYRASVWLSYLTFVVMFMDMSIIIPTLWPFMVKFCTDYGFYAWTLTLFNIAQFFGTPIASAVAAKVSYRASLIMCLTLTMIGNVVYGMAGLLLPQDCDESSLCMPLPNHVNNTGHEPYEPDDCDIVDKRGVYLIFAGRLISGLGGGIIAVCFGLYPHVTTLKHRVRTYSIARGMGSISLMVSPGIAAVLAMFTCTCANGLISKGSPWLNEYTLPGYATAGCCGLLILAVAAFFKDPEEMAPKQKVQVFMTPGLWALIITSALASFVVAAFQAEVVPLTTNEFHWNALDNSLLFTIVGAVLLPGVIIASCMAAITGSDRSVLAVGCIFMVAGLLFDLVPWPPSMNTDPKPQWSFIANVAGICIGYSVITSIAPAIFSKLIPPEHRATMMAFIPMGGSVARTLGPLFGVYFYSITKATPCLGDYTVMCGDRFSQVVLAGLVFLGMLFAFKAWRFLDSTRPYFPPHIAVAMDDGMPEEDSFGAMSAPTSRSAMGGGLSGLRHPSELELGRSQSNLHTPVDLDRDGFYASGGASSTDTRGALGQI